CRMAKETLFSNPKLATTPVTVLGRGSKVIGGSIKGELTRADVGKVLEEGFFPQCPPDAEPKRQRTVGLQELGLPYAADPAVSKHLAAFLQRNAEVLAQRAPVRRSRKKVSQPAAVLFNGGVFKAEILRQRLAGLLSGWADKAGASAVRVLQGTDLDLAV